VDAASRPPLTLEQTQKYIHISIYAHRRRNKANASRDTGLGHARHAQDEVSRPVLRTMGKWLESKTTMTKEEITR